MDVNATELIFMSHRRLCKQADSFTQKVMREICNQVIQKCPVFEKLLVPQCEYLHECPEFFPCGYWEKNIHLSKTEYDSLLGEIRELKALNECGCSKEV